MTIPPRTRLGSYEIVAPLGVGGMGEVYRATDIKLGRDVAIKVLSAEFAQDADRLARLEREARLLALLNHPNIASIYGLEKSDDLLFLVLELVEGPTLRERLSNGLPSIQETLAIFHQIAQALEAAHEKGVIHRDLKPENVKITPERLVKVLDFGLAKALATELPAEDLSQSPTATYRGTSAGVVLGTVPYMSPEQVRAQPLDKRTDIWSFGCCLYEALTSRHPFHGETGSDIIAAIIGNEPDWDALPRKTPRSIRSLLRRCLQKDAHDRLHDVADARIEIGESLDRPSGVYRPETRGGRSLRKPLRYGLVAILGALVGGFLIWTLVGPQPTEMRPVRRFVMGLPATAPLELGSGTAMALSPDGSRLAYVARQGDQTEIYLRPLDQLDPTMIPGTEDGVGPFYSPDGNSLGFFSGGKLKKLPLGGGAPLSMADSPAPRGANWGQDGTIVFSPLTTGGLYSISTPGAVPDGLTTLSSEKGEKSHRWPEILPGGRHVLFTTWTGTRFDIEVLSMESGERKQITEDGSYARYVPTGHLVFVRGGALFAVPFDTERLEVVGPEVSLIEDIAVDPFTGAAVFAFADDGLLVYAPGGAVLPSVEGIGRLLRLNRQGAAETLIPAERAFQLPRLSPNGMQLVVTVSEDDRSDIWGSDLARGTMTRLTFEGNNAAGIWTPDGKRIVFSSDRSGAFNLYWKAADGSGESERLTTSDNIQIPNSLSPDGETLLYSELDPDTGFDIHLLPMTGRRQAESLLGTPYNEVGAAFSPDGKWIAYVSDESGQNEVYIRAYPEGGKWPVSVSGGTEPVWAPNGRELFYRNQEWMMTVSVETEPRFSAGKPRPVFEAPFADSEAAYPNFDITPNGQGFIMIQTKVESATSRLLVVSHWFEELKARSPVP